MKKNKKDQIKKIREMAPKNYREMVELVENFPVKQTKRREKKETIWVCSD